MECRQHISALPVFSRPAGSTGACPRGAESPTESRTVPRRDRVMSFPSAHFQICFRTEFTIFDYNSPYTLFKYPNTSSKHASTYVRTQRLYIHTNTCKNICTYNTYEPVYRLNNHFFSVHMRVHVCFLTDALHL